MLRIYSNKQKMNYHNNKYISDYQNESIKKHMEFFKNKHFIDPCDSFKARQKDCKYRNNLELVKTISNAYSLSNTYEYSIFVLFSIISSYIFYNYNKCKKV